MDQQQIFDTGVDYLTAVSLGDHERVSLGAFAHKILGEEKRLGNEVLPWSMMGYDGVRCGPIQLGERHDSTILRLSSHAASEHWFDAYQRAERITRIDLQVTVKVEGGPKREVMRQHRAVKRHWRGRRDGPAITLWSSDNEGCTLYLGKRTSNVYLRCYNKEAESKDDYYKDCVRFEGEFKGRGAQYALDNLFGQAFEVATIPRFLHQLFRDRGGSPAFAENGLKLRVGSLHRSATTAMRKLEWLTNGVRPSVEFLIKCGLVKETIEALGLTAFVGPSAQVGVVTQLKRKVVQIDDDNPSGCDGNHF